MGSWCSCLPHWSGTHSASDFTVRVSTRSDFQQDCPPPPTDPDHEKPAAPNPRRPEEVAKLQEVAKSTLQELLREAHIALVRNRDYNASKGWLRESYVKQGNKLKRRQEVQPEGALLPGEDALPYVERGGLMAYVGIISHGWLKRGHPDPASKRRDDVKLIRQPFVFWDFLSLLQIPRDASEQFSFEKALKSMHVVYGNSKWPVYRLLTIPANSDNPTAYILRGWCFFETNVAIAAADELFSIEDGEVKEDEKSPVPLTPGLFDDEIKTCRFTSKGDSDTVSELYRKIFPMLKTHEVLTVTSWEDADVDQFLPVLKELTGLRGMTIQNGRGTNAKLSDHSKANLESVLKQRSGELMVFEQ